MDTTTNSLFALIPDAKNYKKYSLSPGEPRESVIAYISKNSPVFDEVRASDTRIYTVTVSNESYDDVEVHIDYVIDSNPNVQKQIYLLHPREVRPMLLTESGRCTSMVAYVISVYVNGFLRARLPEEGVMNPEAASILNPDDREPCADSWRITSESI